MKKLSTFKFGRTREAGDQILNNGWQPYLGAVLYNYEHNLVSGKENKGYKIYEHHHYGVVCDYSEEINDQLRSIFKSRAYEKAYKVQKEKSEPLVFKTLAVAQAYQNIQDVVDRDPARMAALEILMDKEFYPEIGQAVEDATKMEVVRGELNQALKAPHRKKILGTFLAAAIAIPAVTLYNFEGDAQESRHGIPKASYDLPRSP